MMVQRTRGVEISLTGGNFILFDTARKSTPFPSIDRKGEKRSAELKFFTHLVHSSHSSKDLAKRERVANSSFIR
jgi:hypothetical protein